MPGKLASAPSSLAAMETHWVKRLYEHPLEACEQFFGMRPLVEPDLATARASGTDGGRASYLEAPFLASLKVYPSVWKPHINAVMARASGKTETLVKLRIQFALTILPLLIKYIYGLKGAFWGMSEKPLVQILLVSRRVDNSIDILEKATGRLEAESWLRDLFMDEGHWTKKSRRTKVGAQIDIHPCDDSLRGYHGARIPLGAGRDFVTPVLVIFEEATFIKNLDYALREIVLQYVGGEVMMTSSPYGKLGPVWDAWNGDLPVRFANFTASQLQNPLLPRAKILSTITRLLAQDQRNVVLQEILGRFASDAGLFIPNATWLKAVNPELDYLSLDDLRKTPTRILGRFTLGIDPNGGTTNENNHPIGMALTQHHFGGRHQLRWRVKAHIPIPDVIDIVKLLDTKLSLERINVDSGYGSAYPALCSASGIRAKVELIPNSVPRQLSYMTKLRDLMTLGWYELPYDPVVNKEQQSLTASRAWSGSTTSDMQLATTGKETRLPDVLAAMGMSIDQESEHSVSYGGGVGLAIGRAERPEARAVGRTSGYAVRPSLTSVGVR